MKRIIILLWFLMYGLLCYGQNSDRIEKLMINRNCQINKIYISKLPLNDTAALKLVYEFLPNDIFNFKTNEGISVPCTWKLFDHGKKFTIYDHYKKVIQEATIIHVDDDNLVFEFQVFDSLSKVNRTVEYRMIVKDGDWDDKRRH